VHEERDRGRNEILYAEKRNANARRAQTPEKTIVELVVWHELRRMALLPMHVVCLSS
jgi:hypothetical protein